MPDDPREDDSIKVERDGEYIALSAGSSWEEIEPAIMAPLGALELAARISDLARAMLAERGKKIGRCLREGHAWDDSYVCSCCGLNRHAVKAVDQ